VEAPSYRVDVRPILEELGGAVEVDAELELPRIVIGSEEFDPMAAARVRATLTNTGAQGEIQSRFAAACSRCLRDFEFQLSATIEGFYVQHGRENDLPEEQEFSFIEDGKADLMDPILCALALELPFAPLHDPDCLGICPLCGADRNEGDCGCEPDLSSSPFSALKELVSGDDTED
jgi:uncharacterized protein